MDSPTAMDAFLKRAVETTTREATRRGRARPDRVRRGETVESLRACSINQKAPHSRAFIRSSGQVVQLQVLTGEERQGEYAPRGEIKYWTPRSKKGAVKAISALEFPPEQAALMLTLTYPGHERKGYIPDNGPLVTRHLQALIKRIIRKYGEIGYLWKKEFQNRKGDWDFEYQKRAVHLHIWIVKPGGWSRGEWREFLLWIGDEWWEVVGSGGENHRVAGTGVDYVEGKDGLHPLHYFKSYLRKKGKKWIQNVVPEGFRNVGRFWGRGGLLKSNWKAVLIPMHLRDKARRIMRGFLKSRVEGKPRWRSKPVGMFVIANGDFGRKFLQWLHVELIRSLGPEWGLGGEWFHQKGFT